VDEISRLCREIKRDAHDSLIEVDKLYPGQLKRFHLEERTKIRFWQDTPKETERERERERGVAH